MELTVSDLAVARGGVRVLSGISFGLRSGQALVLRGPNGIGKTTVLRSLAGLQPRAAGQVNLPPDVMAYAGHADAIKSVLSVAENLRFWARVYGADDIAPALAAMELEPLHLRPAQSLSAGQKRRLGLARLVLAGRPLWLLDEPTVSLDGPSVQLFAAMLERHLHSGGMALLATHIELGLPNAQMLDLSGFRANPYAATAPHSGFDEAFT